MFKNTGQVCVVARDGEDRQHETYMTCASQMSALVSPRQQVTAIISSLYHLTLVIKYHESSVCLENVPIVRIGKREHVSLCFCFLPNKISFKLLICLFSVFLSNVYIRRHFLSLFFCFVKIEPSVIVEGYEVAKDVKKRRSESSKKSKYSHGAKIAGEG